MKKLLFATIVAIFAFASSGHAEIKPEKIVKHQVRPKVVKEKKTLTLSLLPMAIRYDCGTFTVDVCCFSTYDEAATYLWWHSPTMICFMYSNQP